MEKSKRFSDVEKLAFLKNYYERKKDKEFNDIEIRKEKFVKALLIILECGLVIGLVMVVSFNWNFNWMLDINLWLTNIVSPLCIYNLLTSIWMIVEKRVRRIKLYVRLLYFFFSLIITFVISSSLNLEFVSASALKITLSVVCGVASIIVFVLNASINADKARINAEYESLIISEIIDDYEEDESNKKTKK